MTPHFETLESAAGDLDEARMKIAAVRESLERALEASESPEVRVAIARLDRIEAELERARAAQTAATSG